MNKVLSTFLIIFFSVSFFAFGWISHGANLPKPKPKPPSLLDRIRQTKQLNVVLLNSPSTYYIGPSGQQGFEYDLLRFYARHLGVELNITTAHTINEAIELSKDPKIHITSASLSKTPKREQQFNFGPSYFEVQEQVICNRSMLNTNKFPRDVEDLEGLKISVGEGTSYSETLRGLQKDGFDINVTFTSEKSTEELLEMVSKHEIDCTVADSNIYAINLRYFTELSLAFVISGREQLAWVLPRHARELEIDMYTWLNSFSQSGKLSQLKDHYYSYVQYFDYYNTTIFYKRIKTRLSKYKNYFQNAGTRFGIPWMLLAAMSYQESHWNPKAKSFTGVKGMMMLTLKTAKILGVKNRLNAQQSIIGGTRHLKQMMKFIPESVEGDENRLKYALAAYNVGLGHVKDAMHLAQKMGLNQNVWTDLKKTLPLLAQKKYYKSLKFGYARGSEPVKYVEAIYDYKDILENNCEEVEPLTRQAKI